MIDERRASPRIDIGLPVEFDYLDGQHHHLAGRTINLSATGARLDLGVTLEENQRGVLVLEARNTFMAIAVVAQTPTAEDRRDGATRVEFWRVHARARATLDSVLVDLTEPT
jgi:hypothetical protein